MYIYISVAVLSNDIYENVFVPKRATYFVLLRMYIVCVLIYLTLCLVAALFFSIFYIDFNVNISNQQNDKRTNEKKKF